MNEIEQAIADMLKYEDFCVLTTDNLKDDGLAEGDTVFISGTQATPESLEDVYTLRLKMIVCSLVDDHVQTDKFYLVDPASLTRVDETRQQELTALLEVDFAEEEPAIDEVEEARRDATMN